MKGIHYITDANLNKKAIVIDLKLLKNPKRVEDVFDILVAESRQGDTTADWETVKEKLRKKGKL